MPYADKAKQAKYQKAWHRRQYAANTPYAQRQRDATRERVRDLRQRQFEAEVERAVASARRLLQKLERPNEYGHTGKLSRQGY